MQLNILLLDDAGDKIDKYSQNTSQLDVFIVSGFKRNEYKYCVQEN